MMSITNTNKFETIKNKLIKLEDSKFDNFNCRKHYSYTIPNCFIPKKDNNIPTIKHNIKSIEELQKLQSEVLYMEYKIKELEKVKMLKQTKVEDLRKVIQRIADEDCFDNRFKHNKHRESRKSKSNTISSVGNNCESEETQENGEGAQDGIYSSEGDHFNLCLLYWQDCLCSPLMQ